MTKKERAEISLITGELLNVVLPLPREIKTFFNKYAKNSLGYGTEYVEYIQEYKGRLLNRIFCIQMHGYFGAEKNSCREMARQIEGGKLIVSNLTGGYSIGFQYIPYTARDTYIATDMQESGWTPSESQIVEKSHNYSFEHPLCCINKDKWLKKYPYCAWDLYMTNGYRPSFFKYLCIYRAEPKTELLVKAGYSNFVGCNMLNTKAKSLKDIFKVKQDFALEYLKGRYITRYELSILRRCEYITDSLMVEKYKSLKRHNSWSADKLTEEDIKYIILQKEDSYTYTDYIRFAKELGYPLNEKRYKYPENLKQAHDEANEKLKFIRNKGNDDKIKALIKSCQDFCYEKDGYSIFPLSCAEDLINESKVLEHCVRQYIPDVAKHESLILFVRKTEEKDKPFVTLELVNDYLKKKHKNPNEKIKRPSGKLMNQFKRITQVYGFQDSEPDAETIKFVMDWKNKFKLTGWSREVTQ